MIVPEFDYKMNSFNGDHCTDFDYYSNEKDQSLEMNNIKESMTSCESNEDEENNEKEHETIVEKYQLRSLIGTTISGNICNRRHSYLLVDLIGNGSFAAVFIGKREDGKCFAVKCIPKIDLNDDQLSNQLLEAETLIDLGSHPNILNLHHIIDNKKFLFLVLDLCDIDLYDILTQDYCGIEKNNYGGLAEKDVRYIFNKIADALLYCHKNGIYHRDLKPENILIRFYGNNNDYDVKLTDFGLCTKNDFSEAFGCGSLRYIPPECINDAVASDFMDEETITFLDHENTDPFNKYKPREIGYSARANDAWAMGIILINLLFGRNPWFSASLDDECFMIFVNDDPDFLRKKFGFSLEFNDLVKKIFAFCPCNRCTLEEMVEIFNKIDVYYDDEYYQKSREEFEKEYEEVYDEDNEEIENNEDEPEEEIITISDDKMPVFEEKKTMLSQNFDKYCSSSPSANWSYGERREKLENNQHRSRSRSYLHFYNVPDVDEKYNELPKDVLEKISPVSTLYEPSPINGQNFSFCHPSSFANSISPTVIGDTSFIKNGMDRQYNSSSLSEKEERTMFEEAKKNTPWSFMEPSSPKNINYPHKNGYIHSHLNLSSTEINNTNSSYTSELGSSEKFDEELIFYSDETSHYDNGSKEWKDMHSYHKRALFKKEVSKKLEKENKTENIATTRVKSTGSTSLRLLIESIERNKAVSSGKMKPCEDPAFYNMNTVHAKNNNYNSLRTPPGLKIKHKNSFNKTMHSHYNNNNNNATTMNSHNNYFNNYNSFTYSMPIANQNQMNFMNLSYAMASNYYFVYQNNYASSYYNNGNQPFNKMNLNYYNNNNYGFYNNYYSNQHINNNINYNPINPMQSYFPVAVGN
ncbi:kinase-like protein [Piromyces finnis]|uniref:non-specific serine/threonine protein kinase n=1 Tax=Piromyces finnis TaxID=1754191 RepID=A0A1Y1VII3_9FUNG|nr:kinase-like protein [Piromyces finnis]|eukprot:ORX57214.1 kinase-like protein [Piromyces finnis]